MIIVGLYKTSVATCLSKKYVNTDVKYYQYILFIVYYQQYILLNFHPKEKVVLCNCKDSKIASDRNMYYIHTFLYH